MQYPLINGKRYSFSSIDFRIGTISILGISEISYSSSIEPGTVRGTHPQILGYTKGEYSCEASVSIYKEEWNEAIIPLTTISRQGLLELILPPITVTYAEAGNATWTDLLVGCRISSIEDSVSSGTDPATVTISLMPLYIEYNGVKPMAKMLGQ